MNSRDIVEAARTNFLRAKAEGASTDLPYPGGRWDNYCSQARVTIDRFRTAEEVIHYVQSANTGFESRSTGTALAEQVEALDSICRQMFPDFAGSIPSFVETPYSVASTVTTAKGRPVSAPLLWHMRIVMAIVNEYRAKAVLEIGGGYGAPGRVWMTNDLHRPDTYINVDFPETLFYADVYLRATLPDIDLMYLHEGDRIATRPGTHQIVLCPIHNIDDALSMPALVVNTGSMQEMSDEYVEFYMDKIEQSAADRFYSFNRFAQRLGEPSEMMCFAAPVLGVDWTAKVRRFHAGVRSRAEQFFVRTGPSDMVEADAMAAMAGPDPVDGDAFLALFDAARRCRKSDVLIETARKALRGMEEPPREVVWLLRASSPTSREDIALSEAIETMARNSDIHGVQTLAVRGRVDGSLIFVGNDRYVLTDDFGGAIEEALPIEGAAEFSGWAGDIRRNAPASAVVATVDSEVIAMTVPIGRRPDVEAGYGSGVRPACYTLKVPLPAGEEVPDVRLFCLSSDNVACELRAARQLLPSVHISSAA